MFPSPDQLCARGPEGRFVHEVVVPLVRAKSASATTAHAPALGVQRSFQPGSEWLQINLYSGGAVADEILRDGIDPALWTRGTSSATWIRSSICVCVFMACPGACFQKRGPWSRTRWRRWSRTDAWRAFASTHTCARPSGTLGARASCWRSRFSPLTARPCSQSCGTRIAADDPEARWRTALYGVHALPSDLSLSRAERLSVLDESRSDLVRRLKVEARLDRQLAEKYETLSSSLKEMFASAGKNAWVPPSALAVFEQRSAALAPLTAALRRLETSGQLCRTIPEQAFSYIHMFANRLLASTAPQQELVLYDLRRRFYLESS